MNNPSELKKEIEGKHGTKYTNKYFQAGQLASTERCLKMIEKDIQGIKLEIEEAKKHNTREAKQSIIIYTMWMLRLIKWKEELTKKVSEETTK